MINKQNDITQTKISQKVNKIVIAAMILIAVALGIILSWGLSSQDVLDVKKVPIPTRNIRDHPTAGGVVILNVDYCKNMDIEGDMRISFVSPSREVFLPLVKERSSKGCQKAEFPVLIPKDIPSDTYEVKLKATYNVNPLKRNVTEEFKSAPVIVDPTIPTNER